MTRLRESLALLIRAHLDALTFHAFSPVPLLPSFLLLLLHLVGLAAVFRYFNLPIWYALPVLALLVVPLVMHSRLPQRTTRAQPPNHPTTQLPNHLTIQPPNHPSSRSGQALTTQLPTLAPLFILYAILAARFIYVRAFNGLVPGYFDDVPPQPHAVIFQIEPIAVAVLVYLFTCLLVSSSRSRAPIVLAVLLASASLTWASAEYIGHRARGVTGSDPYAYAQMGVDLAIRGTPLHRFPLFQSVYQLPIAWDPLVHNGYHIPIATHGDAPTVWPPGSAYIYAVAFGFFGEEGLYWVHPLFTLLAAVVTALLAREIFHADNAPTRAWVIALSVFLWATSATVVAWAVIPMADALATVFSVLAIYFAVRVHAQDRRPPTADRTLRITNYELRVTDFLASSILAGVCLALAYLIRHTQLLLAIPIAFILLTNNLPRATRLRALFRAGIAAMFIALPDLYYHQTSFGNWLTPESLELNLFSPSAISHTLSAFLDRFFAAYEFGWLAPFLLYGVYRLARDNRFAFLVFGFWISLLFGFHILYPALRLRDLLPEFPPVIIVTAYGIVALIQTLGRGERAWQKLAATFAIFLALCLPTLRVWNTLRLPFQSPRALFGYLTALQRASFDELSRLTPPRAVIGSTLNSGAIDLYARRESFRPVDFSATERATFIRALYREGRAVYVLNDGAGMSRVLEELSKDFTLRRVAVLDVPLFGAAEEGAGVLWEIVSQ